MGRAPCCDKTKVKKGPWSPEEDLTLKNYVQKFGSGGNWIALPHKAGLKRCGKSCRLRWLNYLRPDIKHGGFTEEEDRIILTLYHKIGSRWSVIASHLPGRTDNDVKNYWNTKLKKKLLSASNTGLIHHPQNNNYSYNFNFNFSTNLAMASGELNHAAAINRMNSYPQNLAPQVLMEVPESCSSANLGTFPSSCQEKQHGSWPGNGGAADEDGYGFLMGFLGSGFPCDLLNDLDLSTENQ
ncbi:hypothetical protein NMG60_11021949 [Bertholletia excelsa]